MAGSSRDAPEHELLRRTAIPAQPDHTEHPETETAAGAIPVAGLLADAPTADRLTVGAAADPAEAQADAVASRTVAALGGTRPPAPQGHGPAAGGSIGADGGDLDPASASTLRALRGSGTALPVPIRRQMEAAMGTDLGGVRVHTGTKARALSDTMQASAFTVGRDVFFRDGLPDTGTGAGQHLLAHELAHTLQPSGQVSRLWNPFKKKEPTAKDLEAAKKKEALLQARAQMKAKDAQARLEAKSVNKTHKQVSEKIKGGYTGTDKNTKTSEHAALEKEFQSWLDKEKAARQEIRLRITGGVGTEQSEGEAELAEERAADLVWTRAPANIRAFRPLRFDDFDKALNEVRELRSQGLAEEHGDITKVLQDNEKNFGAFMDPEKAKKKVTEQRDLERRQVRAGQSKGLDPQTTISTDNAKSATKASQKIAETAKSRPVSKGEQQRVEKETQSKQLSEKYGHSDDIDDASTGTKYAGMGLNYAGKGTSSGTKGVVKEHVFGAQDGQQAQISELVGVSTTGLGQVLTFISDVLSFVSLVSDIQKGVADPGAKLEATRRAAKSINDAAGVTTTGLNAAKEGVQHFGGLGEVIGQVGHALPIVGLISSVLGIIDGALTMAPQAIRLGQGLESVDQALLQKKFPIAASLDRVNSRNTQLVEQQSFSIAKNATMLGLHITELATAGGFGIPMLAKTVVSVTSLAHSLGHKIYDWQSESKSSTALKGFNVKRQEGASRDVVKHDIGTSVDILIVAAQKHKLEYAKKTLMDYGLTEGEVTTMRLHELREKVLDGLDATGDPKTMGEKLEGAKDKIAELLGEEKKPVGVKGDERSTWQKVKDAPGAALDGLKSLPGKVSGAIKSVKQKHADGKKLIEAKNNMAYGGTTDRGRGAAFAHMFRGQDAIEKSYAKVRQEMAGNGRHPDLLPYSSDHQKKRDELAQQKAQSQGKERGGAHQIDKAFMDKVQKASVPQLYEILAGIDQKDPKNLGNLEFLESEVARRLAEAGLAPTG